MNGARPQRRLSTAVLLSALLLGGCAMFAKPAPLETAAAPPVPPLPAATLGQTRNSLQIVRAAFGKQEATMQCAVDVAPQRMQVIALSAMGLRLFSIAVENGQTVVERAPGIPDQVQPEQILRDIQFCYWPLAALQDGYKGTAWEVTEPSAGTRRLKRDGRLIAEVHYSKAGTDPWRSRLWLANFEYGYSLTVDPAPSDND